MGAKKSIGKGAVTCLICGKAMQALARHLKAARDLKPGRYRKRFGIPGGQSTAAKSYSGGRRRMAIDRGLGDKLAAAKKEVACLRTISMTQKLKLVPLKHPVQSLFAEYRII